MDDAGGGRRGPRPSVSVALVEAVRHEYGLSLSHAEDIGGSVNLNVRTVSGERHFVVRVYRSHVTAARVAAVQHSRVRLARAGVPCGVPILTADGASFVQVDGNVVEVERFVTSDAKMDSLDRAAARLPMLARIHELLYDVELALPVATPAFTNYIDAVGVIEATLAGTRRIRGWLPTPDERVLADAGDRLAHDVAQAHAELGHLPGQLVHGDFWDNNVLLRDGRIVMVGDLDFMGERPRIDDLALTLYFATYLLDDPVSEDGLRQLARLVDAYDVGATPRLSAQERAVLPVALARQPLWSLAVWVAQLDDEPTARRHLRGHLGAVDRALAIMADLPRVQAALA